MVSADQPPSVSAENRLLITSLAMAFVIFTIALLTLPGTLGYGVLWFASIPMILTVVVGLFLRLSLVLGHRWPRVVGIVMCAIVCLGVVGSFIIISFALLPNCALLIAASAQPETPRAPYIHPQLQ